MTDMEKIEELLDKYNIGYHWTKIYSTIEPYALAGWACWLDEGGHIEFDLDSKLKNIVTY